MDFSIVVGWDRNDFFVALDELQQQGHTTEPPKRLFRIRKSSQNCHLEDTSKKISPNW